MYSPPNSAILSWIPPCPVCSPCSGRQGVCGRSAGRPLWQICSTNGRPGSSCTSVASHAKLAACRVTCPVWAVAQSPANTMTPLNLTTITPQVNCTKPRLSIILSRWTEVIIIIIPCHPTRNLWLRGSVADRKRTGKGLSAYPPDNDPSEWKSDYPVTSSERFWISKSVNDRIFIILTCNFNSVCTKILIQTSEVIYLCPAKNKL